MTTTKICSTLASCRRRQFPGQGAHSAETSGNLDFGAQSLTPRDLGFDSVHNSTDPLLRHTSRSCGNSRPAGSAFEPFNSGPHRVPEPHLRRRLLHAGTSGTTRKRLRILKFGGTSVGDAPAIEQVIEIVRASSQESLPLVVVSAMCGVTNKLIEAANLSAQGDRELVAGIFKGLRNRHHAAACELILSVGERNRIGGIMAELLQDSERACRGVMHVGHLTLQTRDLILSLGERLSALLVAGALAERGIPSVPVDATEILVTDAHHASAEPLMEPTRERCHARVRPLLQQGVTPVVTGFIGATLQGAITTLGRGSSDYSATILGAALDAHEVVIWTDVDGVLSADPRMVPGASTIPEMSYREAAELAHFGAKVMHPKIFLPLHKSGIPLWVRNTFAPARPGTKITPAGPSCSEGALAITAKTGVGLVTLGGPGNPVSPDALERIFAIAAATQSEVLLISQSSQQSEIRFVVPSAGAADTIEALQREFANDPARRSTDQITFDPDVALVTLVGQGMSASSGLTARTFRALDREHVGVIAVANGSSECNLSFLVAQKDMQAALVAAHRVFQPDHSNR